MSERDRHIVIVGAGVIGVCAAHCLARRGARVTVVDAGEVGAGASMGNAGLLSLGHLPIPQPGVVGKALQWMWHGDSPLYIKPRLDPGLLSWLWRFRGACNARTLESSMRVLGELSTATLGLFEAIHEESGGAFYYERRGYYEVYRTPQGLEQGKHHAEITARHGFGHEVFGGEALREREPAMADDLVGAVFYPDSAMCNPHAFVRAAADLARADGAEILEKAPVTRVDVESGRAVGVTLEDGREIRGDTVVMAAGAWSVELLKRAGVKIPMQPAKGYHLDVPTPEPELKTSCVLGEANMAVTPMDGFVRLAGTLEFSGLNLDIRRERLEMLLTGARRFLKGYAGEMVRLSEWVGMRPCSPDGLPILGWAPRVDGLFLATGHGMLGLTQGPASGKLIGEALLDGQATTMDIVPMSPARF